MSFELPTERKNRFSQPSWSGVAFLVEAMLLLVFLIGSLAVFTQLFAQAIERGGQSETLSAAVAAVGNASERFAADPVSAAGTTRTNGLVVVCEVTGEPREGGIMYHAVISAFEAAPDELGSSEVAVTTAEEGAAREAADAPDILASAEPVYAVSTARYESEVG